MKIRNGSPLIVFRSILIGGCIIVGGCTAVKGYPGPELPDSQLSIIDTSSGGFFNYNRINSDAVDGIELGSGGIKVLPGEHHFDLDASIRESFCDCETYFDSFDSYGWSRCLEKHKSCNYDDYEREVEVCQCDYTDFRCSGTIRTTAGRSYKISLSDNSGGAAVSVKDTEGPEAGTGSCSEYGNHQEETRNSK